MEKYKNRLSLTPKQSKPALNPEIKLRFPIEIDVYAQETEVPVKSGRLVNRVEIQLPGKKKNYDVKRIFYHDSGNKMIR